MLWNREVRKGKSPPLCDLNYTVKEVMNHNCPSCLLAAGFSLLEVGEKEQERALAAALADILWTAGEERTATVSLVTPDSCFTPHLDYKLDNFTERVLFTMQCPVSLSQTTYGL